MNGEDINVPINSVIDFDGGSIDNGTFRFNGAPVIGEPRGTALYGVAYKDGSPLLHNYKRSGEVSLANEFAFFNHDNSSVLYHQTSSQSIALAKNVTYTDRNNNTVTKDLIFNLGNLMDDEDYGLVTMFDKNFNMLGQCMFESFHHSGGCTVIDDYLYVAGGYREFAYVKLSKIAELCDSSSRDNIPDISDAELEHSDYGGLVSLESLFDLSEGKISSVDYDPEREEIALLYNKTISSTEYTHSFLAVLDKDFNMKRKFTVDINDYIYDNYFGDVDFGDYNQHGGIFGDIAYRHGVVTGVFWLSFNWSMKISEIATVIQIDGNTGTPVAYLGKYIDNAYETEPEGICVDPDDNDVFWVNYHGAMGHDGYSSERTPTTFIGRMSFSKKLTSNVLSYENNPRGNVYNKGEIRTIYVDNSYTGFSTGNDFSPFKTLETAMLMHSNASNVAFLLRPTNEPYRIKIFTVGCNVRFSRWYKSGDSQDAKPTILGARLIINPGAKLEFENIRVVGDSTKQSALINLKGGNLIADSTDFIGTELAPSDEQYTRLVVGILLNNGSNVTLKGNCTIEKCTHAFRLYSGGSIDHIDSLNVNYCDVVYRVLEPSNICDNAVSCVTADETLVSVFSIPDSSKAHIEIVEYIPNNIGTLYELEKYAEVLMTKSTNNPLVVRFKHNGNLTIPFGEYLYTPYGLRKTNDNIEWHNSFANTTFDGHNNILLGTGSITILDSSNIPVYDKQEWRKMGTRQVPEEVQVSAINLQGITGGVHYTVNGQGLSKDVILTGKRGWCVFSVMAKGTGSIRLRITIPYWAEGDNDTPTGDLWKEATYILDSGNDWKCISIPALLPDNNAVDVKEAACHIYTVSDNPDITICAPKLEMSSTPSHWTPNEKDFPKGGQTNNRPVNPEIGYQFFDIVLNKLVAWNGTRWVEVGGVEESSKYVDLPIDPNATEDYQYGEYYITQYKALGWKVGDVLRLTQKDGTNNTNTQIRYYNVGNTRIPINGSGEGVVPEGTERVLVQFIDNRDYSYNKAGTFTIEKKVTGNPIAIIGDSISSFTGTSPNVYDIMYPQYYPRLSVTDVNQMWWKIVADTIGLTPANCSWSASRVTGKPKGTDAYAACSDKRIRDVGRNGVPEKIFCFIGCNDWGNEIPLGTWTSGDPIPDDSQMGPDDQITTFKEAYVLMLNKLKTAYPTSTVYACTLLEDASSRDETPGAPGDNADGVTIPQYNQAIKDVAQAMSVEVIDLHECMTYAEVTANTAEGLHPTAAGQAIIARYVINALNS